MVDRGASVIKIALDPSWNRKHPLPMLDLETAKTIVDEAHVHGLLVRAHMIQITYFPLALEAGIDVIEHMLFPAGWPLEEEKRWYLKSDDPTRHAAFVSGADDLGILEPGKLADLIIVDGNPLEDIEALTRIRLVILDGEVAYRSK